MLRLAVLLAVCCVTCFAHLPAWATVVSGQVTRTNGSGIENIDLDFIDRDTGQNIPLNSDTTDVLGFYAVSVPAGRYDIQFDAPAGVRFVSVEIRGVDVEGASMTLNQVLQSGWVVTGRVLGPGSAPVPDIDLDFVRNGNPVYTPHDNTNAGGNYSVTVPAGSYQVEFDTPVGSNLVPWRLDGVAITSDTSLGDVTLAAGFHLTGRTVDTGSAALGDVLVETLNPANGAVIFNIRNRSDGAGFFDVVVAAGTYDLRLTPPAGVPALRTTVNNVTVSGPRNVGSLVLLPGVLASGHVTDSQSRDVRGVDLDFINPVTGNDIDVIRDNTDRDGLYSVAVPAGTYDIAFDPPLTEGLASGILRNVALNSSRVLPTVVLENGRAVSGTVVDGSGVPRAGVDLDFLEVPGGLEFPTQNDDTNASGQFSVLVPVGTYDILFTSFRDPSVPSLTLPNVTVNGNLDLGMVTMDACDLEICDGVDNDCDGQIDEGLTFDADGDGFSATGSCEGSSDDCDDSNAAIHPGAMEVCDGVDNNCDGSTDEGLSTDVDGDGHTTADSCGGTRDDCNDADATTFPGAGEICDGIDNDCDTQIDEGLTFDADRDGHSTPGSCGGTRDDCNDLNAAIHPGAFELCNGIDDDCDQAVDDGAPAPDEVSGMVFVSHDSLSWAAVPDASSYSLYRGVIGSGVFTFNHVCLQPDIVDTGATDVAEPLGAETFYYLSSASNSCGDSGLGFATGGEPRLGNDVCP